MPNTSPNVFISGYMVPLAVGHIEYIQLSKELAIKRGGKLIVCINNDHQATLKKGRPFMRCSERVTIVRALRDVDIAFESIDTDRSVCESLRYAHATWGVGAITNGGDRNTGEVPETRICRELGIETFTKYLRDIGATDNFFWSLGPNSGDVRGVLLDDWTTIDGFKIEVIKALQPSPWPVPHVPRIRKPNGVA